MRASWELSCSTVSVPGETGEEWVRGGSEFLCVCVCVCVRAWSVPMLRRRRTTKNTRAGEGGKFGVAIFARSLAAHHTYCLCFCRFFFLPPPLSLASFSPSFLFLSFFFLSIPCVKPSFRGGEIGTVSISSRWMILYGCFCISMQPSFFPFLFLGGFDLVSSPSSSCVRREFPTPKHPQLRSLRGARRGKHGTVGGSGAGLGARRGGDTVDGWSSTPAAAAIHDGSGAKATSHFFFPPDRERAESPNALHLSRYALAPPSTGK